MVETIHCQQLLRDLKNTSEGLLVTQVANVWSIYGGLSRLHSTLAKIFKHGCKEADGFFNFVQGLEWLQPESSKSCFSLDCEYKPHIPSHLKDDRASIWLYRSLENHSLSQKLSWLLSDNTHLRACYQSYAFLCQEKFAEATLICLRSVERNQPSLMSEINPCLLLAKSNEVSKVHRRCSSFPDSHLKMYETRPRSKTIHDLNKSNTLQKNVETIEKAQTNRIPGKIKPWSSMPCLHIEKYIVTRKDRLYSLSRTTPSTPVRTRKISPSLLKVDYCTLQSQSDQKVVPKQPIKKSLSKAKKSLKHVLVDSNIVEHTPPLSSSQSSGVTTVQYEELMNYSTKSQKSTTSPKNMANSPLSMVEYRFLPMPGEKDYTRQPKKTFIEDGGMTTLPIATGYFPKPAKGQTLMSFLTSSQFTRTNAELDRENAHFRISEAIISAMEQLKCKRDLKLADEQLDDSDPEILDLKQRIRLRRRQKLVEKHRKQWAASMLSDGKTDTTTTVSPCSTPADSLSDSSSDDVDDLEIDQAYSIHEHGLSLSMASLYSEADIVKRPRGAPDGASDILSAESVALSLISKFNEKHLPRASDLEWLVSEEDAPQALLPLPKSWPVSPDDSEDAATPLRGTHEWAPPRPQIIFTLHPQPVRKLLLGRQNYRCAGCSMKVDPQYASKFRYCDYLGKYFCTGCHKNQVALIPGRILHKWDFNRYPVSTFSYRLLEQMYTDPLFRIFELSKNIGRFSKNILFCRKYRLGLCYLKEYICTCRFAETVQERLQKDMPSYALTDPEVYSLEDLVNIKNGVMKNKLRFLVEICCRHTSECKLCLARGFICEVCNADEVIFPWQMRIVSRCDKCFMCYHIKCWNPSTPCLKCVRISKRNKSTNPSLS